MLDVGGLTFGFGALVLGIFFLVGCWEVLVEMFWFLLPLAAMCGR